MKQLSDLTRYSRAGDQFHYRWAARRCLALLDASSNLNCITIEGVSSTETPDNKAETGEEVVDVAEYYGGRALKTASKIAYLQLKHSYSGKPWTLSALKKTLEGFVKRFQEVLTKNSNSKTIEMEFVYVTNREAAQDVKDFFYRIRSGDLHASDKKKWQQILGYMEVTDEEIAKEFLKCFRIDDSNDIHWKQRNILIEELKGYIAGHDKDVADQLWRMVTEKALPEHSKSSEITREDVLRYLNTDEQELYPAPCKIENNSELFQREQEEEILSYILKSDGAPIIVHADGGVGKSALAVNLFERTPTNSFAILYDCFGNGEYRSQIHRRDLHSVALVQISNELAARGLCHPLIPSNHASSSDYIKGFVYRLEQAINVLKSDDPEAKLLLYIDAADNSQMAAEENGERACFAKDIIREQLPEGVVPIFFCRSHRKDLLNPPTNCIEVELRLFSELETEKHLKVFYADIKRNDVREFHRLTSQNPRVQATILARKLSLPDTLAIIGPSPVSVEEAIKSIFESSLRKLFDNTPQKELTLINKLCEALAAFQPFIPIKVLSLASGLQESAIKSFCSDLGRPITLLGDYVQFFDEPSETWFREKYKPQAESLKLFISNIEPFASDNSFISSALPQLMLDAGQYEKLIDLVINDNELPVGNPVDKRNTSLFRLQFALKAAIRRKRYEDAAKLALKAGGETAGIERQHELFQANTFLISKLLEPHRLREIVSKRTFAVSWHGGHYAYYACLLSGCNETLGEARSYLRLAHKWLDNWTTLSREEREKNEVNIKDIAEIALSTLQLEGAKSYVTELDKWKPKNLAFEVSILVFQRLANLEEFELLDEIVCHSGDNFWIMLAATYVKNSLFKYPNANVIFNLINHLNEHKNIMQKTKLGDSYQDIKLSVICSVVQAAIVRKCVSNNELIALLDAFIPDPDKYYFSQHSDEPHFTIVRANCIRAELKCEELKLADLAKPKIQEKLQKEGSYYDSDTNEFVRRIGAVLPWHKLWVKVLMGQISSDNLCNEIDKCLKEGNKAINHYEIDSCLRTGEIAKLWLEIIQLISATKENIGKFIEWKNGLKNNLFTPTLLRLAEICSLNSQLHCYSYEFANEIFGLISSETSEVEGKIQEYIKLSILTYRLNPQESKFYFGRTIEVASNIGQENMERWSALLEVAISASEPNKPKPELSYRLSRNAEFVYQFVARDKYFRWGTTIDAITKLCPSSSLSTLSRWKDRRFGDISRVLPQVICNLVSQKKISIKTALALTGYQYEWKLDELVGYTMDSLQDENIKNSIFESVLRYLEIRGCSKKVWKTLEQIANKNDLHKKCFADEILKSEDLERLNGYDYDNFIAKPDPPKNWDVIFDNADVTSVDDIYESYRIFKSGPAPFFVIEFAKELFDRVPIGSEAAALKSLFSNPDFKLFDIRGLYEAVPEEWLSRNHIKAALFEITRDICKRFYYEITKTRYYEYLPFEIITNCSGVSEKQIYDWVIEEVAASQSIHGSGRLFTLVGIIASSISISEAEEVLKYGLALIENEMTPDFGDGNWDEKLTPPTEVNESLAGYIWVSLCSPIVEERWEAAHCVCFLCEFGEFEILEALAEYANGRNANQYYDARLPLYDFSGKLWLLFALRRAQRKGFNKSVLKLIDFVKLSCAPGVKHVLVRGIASKIMNNLCDENLYILPQAELSRLKEINRSKLDIIVSSYHRRSSGFGYESLVGSEDKYYFGHDIGPYWFERLGSSFALNSQEIERRALRIMRKEWGVTGSGGWKDDPRYNNIFGNKETHHSRGSYPRTENLSFYHAYHSMMEVAGELIDEVQLHQENDSQDEWEEWLKRHDLAREDGLWLFDRRDSNPLQTANWKFENEGEKWLNLIKKKEISKQIFFGEFEICVGGHWNNSKGDRLEDISISSSLVNSQTSHALLRALHSVKDPNDYCLPSSESDMEIIADNFQLKGWVSKRTVESGIDKSDPWSGDIDYPAMRPAEWIVKHLNLKSDYESRRWYSELDQNIPFAKSFVWGQKSQNEDLETPECGSLLLANIEGIKSCLASLSMDLIFEIRIERSFKYNSYYYRKFESKNANKTSRLILLMDRDGRITTI